MFTLKTCCGAHFLTFQLVLIGHYCLSVEALKLGSVTWVWRNAHYLHPCVLGIKLTLQFNVLNCRDFIHNEVFFRYKLISNV